MRNVSKQFIEDLYNDNRQFYVTAKCLLASGIELDLKREDFALTGNGFIEAADSSGFPIGIALQRTAKLCLINNEHQFDDYSFTGAVFTIYINLDLSTGTIENPNTESIKIGKYTVKERPTTAELINLTLLDDMARTEVEFETDLFFPTTAATLLYDCCQRCGLALGDRVFPNSTTVIYEKPQKTTFRNVIGGIAMLAGGNAILDEDNYLRIKTFDTSVQALGYNLDGGDFSFNDAAVVSVNLREYMNTTEGMTQVVSTYQDDNYTTLTGVDWFSFNDVVASTIYVNSNSKIKFGGTMPSSTGSTEITGLNICRRDGQLHYLYTQVGEVDWVKFYKIRYDGYTRFSSQYRIPEYALIYEVFLLSTGHIVLNMIQTPTNSDYYGISTVKTSTQTLSLSLVDGTGGGNVYLLSLNEDNLWEVGPFNYSVTTINDYDGGVFNPWETGYIYDSGVGLSNPYHFFYGMTKLQYGFDYTYITGVQVRYKPAGSEEEIIYLVGDPGFVLDISDNPVIETNGDNIINYTGDNYTTNFLERVCTQIFNAISDVVIRSFSLDHVAYPLATFLDPCYFIDTRDRVIFSYISDIDFEVGGLTSVANKIQDRTETSTSYSSDFVQIAQQIDTVTTVVQRYAAQIEQLNNLAQNATPYYQTVEVANNKSIILYIHNVETLSASTIVYKICNEGVFLSKDGGRTWISGIDKDGNIVSYTLCAGKINATDLDVENITSAILDASCDISALVDSALSVESANPIENRVLTPYINEIYSRLPRASTKYAVSRYPISQTSVSTGLLTISANSRYTGTITIEFADYPSLIPFGIIGNYIITTQGYTNTVIIAQQHLSPPYVNRDGELTYAIYNYGSAEWKGSVRFYLIDFLVNDN